MPADMRGLVTALDLDRTMIYSRAALGVPLDSSMHCVEIYQDAPLSYMTGAAMELLRTLTDIAVVVPTTTRTIEQFQRITLPGAPWRYAITSNGGNILLDGTPDDAWRAQFTGVDLDSIRAELTARARGDWVLKRRTADGLFCYLVVEPAAVPPDFLTEWSQWCAERGWNVSQQGRKIYTMPDAVSKSRAVAEVRARCIDDGLVEPDVITAAAGDGALDADMLIAADRAIRPRHGELELLGFDHPRLVVTTASGGRASEEILRWMHTQAGNRVEP